MAVFELRETRQSLYIDASNQGADFSAFLWLIQCFNTVFYF